jgi:SpoVK/Ycf46/Vps4 family AAA+-type ATPase
MRWTEVPSSQLKEPDLSSDDLLAAFKKVKPSVGGEEMQKYEDWTEKFGLEGA